MKIHLAKKLKQVASSLVTVLVVCAIMSMSISYYLSLVEQQNILSSRSQSWNMAMTITEAGLEEGLQQINSNSSNLAADGWTYDGTLYWRSNTMPDGSSYSVNINFSTPDSPTLVARAYVAAATQTKLFGAVNIGATTTAAPVTRAIRVKASRGSLFLNALVAKNFIDLNGNGVSTDSYDSSDPTKSTNGKYDATKYAGDMGDVAANAGIVNALDIGNANIYGHAHVGPGGTDQIGSNGKIGEHSWQATHTSGAETGWFAADANFTFPETGFPYANNTAGVLNTAPGGDIVTTTYNYGTNSSSSTAYPNGASPWTTVSTNFSSTSSWGAVPNPTPNGTYTNYTTQYLTLQSLYPSAGTYLGPVTTNYSGQSGNIKTYNYYRITSTTYYYPSLYAYNTYSTNTIYTTNHYDHILMAGTSYYMNTLDGSTYVAGLDVKLVVANGINLTQPFVIPKTAGVEVWTGGTSLSMSGNSGANDSGSAGAFIIYATPSVTSFSLTGNGKFTGVLVMPGVDLTLNGSGSGNQDFCGSIMAKSVTLTGHFNFHYDESLKHVTKQGRYLVTTWDEIP